MRLKIYVIAIIASGIFFNATAQDIHFSQFYASPLTLNPTFTGFSEGTYRAAAIYRNQWRSVTSPYQTYAGSFDIKLLQEKLKNDIFGVGGVIVSDKAGDANLKGLSIMASAAYLKLLGAKTKHYLGIGLQLGYVQRSLDQNDLTFPSQFVDGNFDQNTPSGENLEDNVSYFDLQAGVLWSAAVHKRVGIFSGVSIFHITQPKESFLGQKVHLKSRFAVHAGLKIMVTENIYLTPNFIFMYQNKAQEKNVGTAVEYHFLDKHHTIVSLGGWYRTGDAGIVSLGLEHRNIRFGFSYDINSSELKPATDKRGAFEVSLMYIGKIVKPEVPMLVPCPRL